MTVTRREVLLFLGAGAAAATAPLRAMRAWAVTCPPTPAATEAMNFVDELLARSDIRVDPSDGSVQQGVPLRLAINV